MRKSNPEDVNIDELRKLGYERADVSLPTLIRWIVFLFVFVGISSAITWVIYVVFVPSIGEDMRANPQKLAKGVPSDPQIQAAPKRDMREFRIAEDRILNSYGWADKTAGTVHIPIDKAMADIAEHGLPAREPGPIPGSGVQSSPTTQEGLTIRPGEPGTTFPRSQPPLPQNNTQEPQSGPSNGGGAPMSTPESQPSTGGRGPLNPPGT
jgi:hypothetical protein